MTAPPRVTAQIVAQCQELFDDLDFGAARRWKASRANCRYGRTAPMGPSAQRAGRVSARS